MERLPFDFQEIGPVYPSNHHAWVSVQASDKELAYVFYAFYPRFETKDFDGIFVPSPIYDPQVCPLSIFEKRTLYVKACGEYQTMFRVPQDADLSKARANWCEKTTTLEIVLPRMQKKVLGDVTIPMRTERR